MKPRAVVATLADPSRTPALSPAGRGATAAEPSLVELLTQRRRVRPRLRGRVPRRRGRGGVRATPAHLPERARAADAPPGLRRGLRPRSRHRLALVAAARRLRGGRGRRPRPAGASREAPPRRARPSASSGRGRSPTRAPASTSAAASGTSTCRPSCSPSSTRPCSRASRSRGRGATTIEGRSFVEIAFRELAAPTVIRGPDVAPGRARRGSGLDPRREGRHGGPHRARPGPGRGRSQDPRDPDHRVPPLPGARPVGPGRDARPPPDRSSRGHAADSGSVEFVDGLAAYSSFRRGRGQHAGGVPGAEAGAALTALPAPARRGRRNP